MKNLKIKKAAAAASIIGITLLSSLGKNEVVEASSESPNIANDWHYHLYLTIGENTIIFRECDGYVIDSDATSYTIKSAKEVGITDYNTVLTFPKDDCVLISAKDESYIHSIDEIIESDTKEKVYKYGK